MNVIFAGTPGFAAGHLSALIDSAHEVVAVITQPDKPGKRGKKPVASPVKLIAEAAGLPCLQPDKLKVTDLAQIDVDVMVVVAYGQILRDDVLSHPRLGCINVHASLLPRWRGAAPVQRAIEAGDAETGVTIIQMDAGLDTGDMLAKRSIVIEPDDTAGTVLDKMLISGRQALIDSLDDLANGVAVPEPQDDNLTCYARKIRKEEAQIRWEHDAVQIDRSVRAFNPDPVSYCFLDGKRVKVHQGHAVDTPADSPTVQSGQIVSIDTNGIVVACGSGRYQITAIQLPIGKGSVLKPADVLNGWTNVLHPGVCFDAFAETTQ